MIAGPLLLSVLLSGAALAPGEELWAGHQTVTGSMKIPVLGRIETRTDSFYLARVLRKDGRIEIEQHVCKVDLARVMGSQARIEGAAARKIPPVQLAFTQRGGTFLTEPYPSGWGKEDVEGDGFPGLTVALDAPLCGGELRVSSQSITQGRGRFEGEELRGEVRVTTRQEVIEASNACLAAFSSDTEDRMRGTFAYRPVPPGTTCEDLLAEPWPVRARAR